MLAIRLMRTGARSARRIASWLRKSNRNVTGAYLENLGTYNPTREPAEINLKSDRVQYWIGPRAPSRLTPCVSLIKQASEEPGSGSSCRTV